MQPLGSELLYESYLSISPFFAYIYDILHMALFSFLTRIWLLNKVLSSYTEVKMHILSKIQYKGEKIEAVVLF